MTVLSAHLNLSYIKYVVDLLMMMKNIDLIRLEVVDPDPTPNPEPEPQSEPEPQPDPASAEKQNMIFYD